MVKMKFESIDFFFFRVAVTFMNVFETVYRTELANCISGNERHY